MPDFNDLFLVSASIYKKKTNKIIILTLSCFIIFFIVLSSIYCSLSNLPKNLNALKYTKTIEVNIDEYKEIAKIPFVRAIYKASSYHLKVSTPFDKELTLYAANENEFDNIVVGSNKLLDGSYEMICPEYYYSPNLNIIKLTDYYDHIIPIRFKNEEIGRTETINVKMTGNYRNTQLVDSSNACFLNDETMKNIAKSLHTKTDHYVLEIEDVMKLNKVKNFLDEEKIPFKSFYTINLSFYEELLYFVISCFLILFIAFIGIMRFLAKHIYQQLNDIMCPSLSLGWSRQNAVHLYFVCLLLIWFTSTAIASVFVLFYLIVIKDYFPFSNVLRIQLFYFVNIKVLFISSFFLFYFLLFFSSKYMKKLRC